MYKIKKNRITCPVTESLDQNQLKDVSILNLPNPIRTCSILEYSWAEECPSLPLDNAGAWLRVLAGATHSTNKKRIR